MDFPILDRTAALIVVGGTLLATLLRCGPVEIGIARRGLHRALRRGYSAQEGKAELATLVGTIRNDGLLRASSAEKIDPAFAQATEALLQTRSIAALQNVLVEQCHRRQADADTAAGVFALAAELAPVFGMAGTLIALSQLSASNLTAGEAITEAIGLSVVTTLYGILLANLFFAPLARLVERTAAREERERQIVADWLAAQIADALPSGRTLPPDLDAFDEGIPMEAM